MITREQIPTVLDHPVFDDGGNKIGEAAHVFLDDATGRPEWVTVKTGWFGSSESFVPIRDASMVADHIEVPFAKGKVKGAPHVDVDAGGHLSVDEEHRLYDYYGVPWDEPTSRTGRAPGDAAGTTGTAGGAGAAGAAGAAGTRGTTGTTGTAGTQGAAGAAAGGAAGGAAAGRSATPGRAGTPGRAESPGRTPTAGRRAGADDRFRHGDDAMTRSEERMHVGVERRETGRARLRKYVVTEDVEQTVPLRHEEVRIEREPITDANRGDAVRGPEISEAEYELTLHAERPVVETEAVPVERVRLTTEEHTEQETVHGRVRKERIEGETERIESDRDRGDEGGIR